MPVILSVTHPGLPDQPASVIDTSNSAVTASHRVAIHLVKVTHDPEDATRFGRDLLAAYSRTSETEGAELTHAGTGLTYRIDPVPERTYVSPPERLPGNPDHARVLGPVVRGRDLERAHRNYLKQKES